MKEKREREKGDKKWNVGKENVSKGRRVIEDDKSKEKGCYSNEDR